MTHRRVSKSSSSSKSIGKSYSLSVLCINGLAQLGMERASVLELSPQLVRALTL